MHCCCYQVPLWVWIAWIPQLLVSLQRPESLHCKRILTLLALSYPQAWHQFACDVTMKTLESGICILRLLSTGRL